MASGPTSRALNAQDTAKGSRSEAQDTLMGGRSSAQDIAKAWRDVGERDVGDLRDAQTGPAGAQKMVSDYISSTKPEDIAFMRRALELAEQHRGRTSPNPIVGCVIVDEHGRVIAEGAHRGPGLAHAEADALAKLARGARGDSANTATANTSTANTATANTATANTATANTATANTATASTANTGNIDGVAGGATMYVNLEPCTHHGRTPPCVLAVMASGVARVVVGSEDPVPGHGGGMEMLRRAGITIERALVAESDAANRPFFTWAREARPAFTLKAAVTLDGKLRRSRARAAGSPARLHARMAASCAIRTTRFSSASAPSSQMTRS
jgi:pyrimidine deaminase RibD-like protein